MSDQYFEEEEFSSEFNGKTVIRILSQTKPHWRWVVGFLISVITVSILDGYFTFLNKRIIDEGILPGNRSALIGSPDHLRRIASRSGSRSFRVYLPGGSSR